MNNRYHIVIFVVIVAIVAGFIWYNATTIDEINPEMTTAGQNGANAKQKDINVLTDIDIEEDMSDLDGSEDLSDFDDMDDLIGDEEVAF